MINVIIEKCIKYPRNTENKVTMPGETGKSFAQGNDIFIRAHSFNKYLSTYYVPGTILGIGNTEVNKERQNSLSSRNLHLSMYVTGFRGWSEERDSEREQRDQNVQGFE